MPRITVKSIAEVVGLHPNTLRNWCDQNLIECVRDFRGVRWFPNKVKTIRQVNELLGLALSENSDNTSNSK